MMSIIVFNINYLFSSTTIQQNTNETDFKLRAYSDILPLLWYDACDISSNTDYCSQIIRR